MAEGDDDGKLFKPRQPRMMERIGEGEENAPFHMTLSIDPSLPTWSHLPMSPKQYSAAVTQSLSKNLTVNTLKVFWEPF